MISVELTAENRPACVPLDSVFSASAPKVGTHKDKEAFRSSN
jgi:hypothetical protein